MKSKHDRRNLWEDLYHSAFAGFIVTVWFSILAISIICLYHTVFESNDPAGAFISFFIGVFTFLTGVAFANADE